MNGTSIANICAAICGLIAAYYWYKSSGISFWPAWEFEPVVEEQKNMDRFDAIMKGVGNSSKLNKLAALWTAASVILSSTSSLASAFL